MTLDNGSLFFRSLFDWVAVNISKKAEHVGRKRGVSQVTLQSTQKGNSGPKYHVSIVFCPYQGKKTKDYNRRSTRQ